MLVSILPFVYFEDDFTNSSWKQRWTYGWVEASGDQKTRFGSFERTSIGSWNGTEHWGLTTLTGDAEYLLGAKTIKPLSVHDGDMILSFSARMKSKQNNSNAYVTLMPGIDWREIRVDSPYLLQFGPGVIDGKLRLIARMMEDGHVRMLRDNLDVFDDDYTHNYALFLLANGSYSIWYDEVPVRIGEIAADFLDKQGMEDLSKSREMIMAGARIQCADRDLDCQWRRDKLTPPQQPRSAFAEARIIRGNFTGWRRWEDVGLVALRFHADSNNAILTNIVLTDDVDTGLAYVSHHSSAMAEYMGRPVVKSRVYDPWYDPIYWC